MWGREEQTAEEATGDKPSIVAPADAEHDR
jgi:hypothetical protein